MGNEVLAAQLWECPLDELAQYTLTVTAADGTQTSPASDATFFTLPDNRTGLWLLGSSLADGSGNQLDGDVPAGFGEPEPAPDRHGCPDSALHFSEGDQTAIEIGPPAAGEWPALGTGLSFSVWVQLPTISGSRSVKDAVVFAKPHPDSHQMVHEQLYSLSVDYDQDESGDQGVRFRLFLSDTSEGRNWVADTIDFPELTGSTVLGDQWIHVAASYEYGSATMMLVVSGEPSLHDVFDGSGFVWDDEGKNFTYAASRLLLGAVVQSGQITPAFSGKIDDLILWDRALELSELLAVSSL